MPDILAYLLWLETQFPGLVTTADICPVGGGGTDGGVDPQCS